MDFPTLPPRVDPTAHMQAGLARLPKHAVATRPEIALPVLATLKLSLPAPIKGLGIAPLDLFQVGDNDDIPQPPDPPRRPATLTMMEPAAPPLPEAAPQAPRAQPPGAPDLQDLVKSLEDGPENPTLDIRR